MTRILSDLYAGLIVLLLTAAGIRLLVQMIRRLRGGTAALSSGRYTRIPPAEVLAAVFGVAVLSRIVLFLWSFLLLYMEGIGTGSGMPDFYRLWIHWDARHYYSIATEGYPSAGDGRLRLVFFPLYPLLMRSAALFTGNNVVIAGTLISVLSGAGAAVLLTILAYNVPGVKARETVLFFLLNPLSVFLCCLYTEGLFLLLALSSFLLRRFGHPWLGALCGLLASFTRMPGIVLAGFILIDLLDALAGRALTGREALCGIAQMLIVFTGLFLYWGVNAAVTGDPFMYLTYQRENWFQTPGTVWNSARNTMDYFLTTAGEEDHWWTWGAQAVVILLVVLMLVRAGTLPFDLMAYSFVYIAVVLSPTWLLSAPRYLFGLFVLPLLETTALARMPRPLHVLCLICSGGLLLLYVYGYTIAVEVL